ncbi:hypothetical protein GEMRC1_006052 [Eukaryota sp. GEM-RC1]
MSSTKPLEPPRKVSRLRNNSLYTQPTSELFAPAKSLHFQQSLLFSISSHFLKNLLNSSDLLDNKSVYEFPEISTTLFTFFKQYAYVSQYFFESALTATKIFMESNNELNYLVMTFLFSFLPLLSLEPMFVRYI